MRVPIQLSNAELNCIRVHINAFLSDPELKGILDKFNSDTWVEDYLGLCWLLVKQEEKAQTHPVVISCLESVRDSLEQAVSAYYASTK